MTSYDDWIGVDCFFAPHVDVVTDLRRSSPFPDSSVNFCFSEHFLEHLNPEEGCRHLEDVCRILKPGGVYRVVVPHAVRFMKKYIEKDDAFFERAFPWADENIDAVYSILNWGGRHRNILDFPTLERMAKQAGFESAIESSAQSSEELALRIDITNPQRVEESLYVEIRKRN
jgi:predicted SAM-dependent methyltransferase